MALKQRPVVRQQMLIRKPVSEVYEAFVDPAITTKFWFTRSSGRLEPGANVTWEWEMYGAVAPVSVKAMETNARILIEWHDPAHPVEFSFDGRDDGTTLVAINVSGFHGDDEAVVPMAMDSMGGFTFLLAAAKAWLEHGIELNVVADHHPDAHVT